MHPSQSSQQMLERFGFDSFNLKSEDTVGSTDPARPSVFTGSRRMVISAGEKMFDPATEQQVVLPVELAIDTQTVVSGTLEERRFTGSFSVAAKYNVLLPPLEMSGTFEIRLS
jgi:hypothetical protein